MPTAYPNLIIDKDSQTKLGSIPAQWQSDATTLVVRDDGKPLKADTLRAVCKYCKEMVQPLLLEAKRSGSGHLDAVFEISTKWEEFREADALAEGMGKMST